MPYNYWWEVGQHVLYVSYSGDMSVEELTESMQVLTEEMKLNGGPFVNIISDVGNVQHQLSLPEVMKAVRQFETSEQMGWSIMVGNTNAIMRFTNNVAGQFLGQRMRSFDTPEEAIAFLKESDPSIDWGLRRSD